MQPIAEALARVTLGTPSQFQNLTVFPLLATKAHEPDYVLLDDALARKLARVTEVSESGHVPELLFLNDGDAKVLLVDGEELVGARQNRILNVSILVGAQQKIVVPVSCVEQGRWHYRSRPEPPQPAYCPAKVGAEPPRQSLPSPLAGEGPPTLTL